jgi:23S rRNA G2069 N7-methylase RlmK/C1962 C5-methylase RlmI
MAEKDLRQAEYFGNRLEKRRRQLSRWVRKQGIECYRLYDNDIPEIPLAVDAYGGCLVMALYERPYDKADEDEAAWLSLMAQSASERLGIPLSDIHVKLRKRQRGLSQYAALERSGREMSVKEGGHSFIVNLSDYLDTGLFLDHRPLRAEVGRLAPGRRFLNLFAYTGSFSVYAAAAGAARVVSLDLSATYLDWAKRNFALNSLESSVYEFIRADATRWLALAPDQGGEFDIIVLDPPTFSNSKRMQEDLDIGRDYARLIAQAMNILAPEGILFFSTNSRRFALDQQALPDAAVKDISQWSVPEDFRDRRIHRAWEIRHQAGST